MDNIEATAGKIEKIVKIQKQFFETGKTLDINFRIETLKKLKAAIISNEENICKALREDLGKSAAEAYMTEIGTALSEINYFIKHTKKLSRKKKVCGTMATAPSRQFIIAEPYGRVLIMAPWNYPFLLCIDPAVSAIAAGNCVLIKPSKSAACTSKLLSEIISQIFDPGHVSVLPNMPGVHEALLESRFDYIFYTGSPEIGKKVMEKAAKWLTPVTLELGGKSPCIIDETADIQKSMRRIIFGKTLNSGQTCIAPDFLMVHQSHKATLTSAFKTNVEAAWGLSPINNPNYPFIVNDRHFARITNYLQDAKILCGGKFNPTTRKIEPTLIEGQIDTPVMNEEIFGPILPVIWFNEISEVKEFLQNREKPLALYFFSNNKRNMKEILTLPFGGGCINDTIMHLSNFRLPFGGVGNSGMGSYHGQKGFDTFTHYKSILKKPFALDVPIRYQPITKFKERLIRLFMK